MRKNILLILLSLACMTAIQAQEVRISVAPAFNGAPHYFFVTGGPGQEFKPGFSSSVDFLFPGEKKIKLGFGLTYQFSKVGFYPNLHEGERVVSTLQVDNNRVKSWSDYREINC